MTMHRTIIRDRINKEKRERIGVSPVETQKNAEEVG